ncbi:GNAT family N-acetyltransferase [Rhizohabitans arisaemae]|uniref:GNAT family N-acetyltransferase n=1 Tax=Rhizohabitans arisaemae TaxID=2720610 RepID=UPI0024B191D8|nr:GNAT family N-acetyltransferase [Rhizohabitans arisaemae]
MVGIEVRVVGPEDWEVWRRVRLAGLADAPDAFASTLAEEQGYDEARWRESLGPGRGVRFIAFVDEAPVGMAGGLEPEKPDGRSMLISMWVTPAARGSGIAGRLISEVVGWSKDLGHRAIELWVVDGNETARRLYLKNGFEPVEEYMQLPSNPALREQLLVRTL